MLLLDQVNGILDFSRVEAGKLELESAPFELRGLLDDTLQIVAERAHARGLELMLDADGSLPSTVVGDAGRLRQVVLNLLGNAIKFTESGEVVLTVRAVAPERLGFEVTDTGIGIAADALPRLFQPFSQADRSTTRRFGGTGLGLAICRQLVVLMGGEIGVESEPGRGSRFWFEISLPAGEALDVPLPSLPRGHRALCVDDHPRHRAILASMLARLNVETAVAADLVEADARLAAAPADRRFEIVVLDAELEGADAWTPGGAVPPAILALTSDAGRLAAPAHWSAILPRPVREPLFAATCARLVGAPTLTQGSRAMPPALASSSAESDDATGVPDIAPGLLVLVVDDNAINQRVATRSLQKLGCRVETAQNGREALDAADRTSFALILMDCQMPEMDGYAATRALRAREGTGPRTPIVAMTAGARAEDREACLASGMDDYLSKPFALDDLRRVVARWAVLAVRP
jgi:CheY-like chemotaxis protein